MQKTVIRCIFPFIFQIIIILTLTCFSACTNLRPPRTLYSWGSYEVQVYAYLKGESREAQIEALERDREKIEASGYALPPGFCAQLGLLYAEAGDYARAVSSFEAEKAHFPEAAVYMDFLLNAANQESFSE